MTHHNSVALLIVTVNACIGFVASMAVKYALLCTFVWEVTQQKNAIIDFHDGFLINC